MIDGKARTSGRARKDRVAMPLALVLGLLALPIALAGTARAQTVELPADTGGVLGQMVRSQSDKELGRVVDVLVDPAGQPEAVVIDFGGFLGVGSRRIAVAWSSLKFGTDHGALVVSLDVPTDRIKAAPEYAPGKPVRALTPVPAQ